MPTVLSVPIEDTSVNHTDKIPHPQRVHILMGRDSKQKTKMRATGAMEKSKVDMGVSRWLGVVILHDVWEVGWSEEVPLRI